MKKVSVNILTVIQEALSGNRELQLSRGAILEVCDSYGLGEDIRAFLQGKKKSINQTFKTVGRLRVASEKRATELGFDMNTHSDPRVKAARQALLQKMEAEHFDQWQATKRLVENEKRQLGFLPQLAPLANHGATFKQKSPERMDALSRAMWKTLLAYEEKNGRLPTAKVLWYELPVGGRIQEKEIDTADDRAIYWIADNRAERETTFNGFKDRLTILRKKFKKMHS